MNHVEWTVSLYTTCVNKLLRNWLRTYAFWEMELNTSERPMHCRIIFAKVSIALQRNLFALFLIFSRLPIVVPFHFIVWLCKTFELQSRRKCTWKRRNFDCAIYFVIGSSRSFASSAFGTYLWSTSRASTGWWCGRLWNWRLSLRHSCQFVFPHYLLLLLPSLLSSHGHEFGRWWG